MGFIALIFALLIEQGRPLPQDNLIYRASSALARSLRQMTDAGREYQGIVGWAFVVAIVLAFTLIVQWLAAAIHPLAVFVLHVLVLYLTVGFRQFSRSFSEIQIALAAGEVATAHSTVEQWTTPPGAAGSDDDGAPVDIGVVEICRRAIAHALVASQRHVFGPLFWYVLVPGVAGPIIYRVAEMLARHWSGEAESDGSADAEEREAAVVVPVVVAEDPAVAVPHLYGSFARRAYGWIDWIPVRLSAAGFAVVGNFEDAVFCWRGAVAAGTGSDQRAMLIAVGSGALGLRIADPELEARWAEGAAAFEWSGSEPDANGLNSAVGLVWRSVVLWIGLFAMLTIAAWLGR